MRRIMLIQLKPGRWKRVRKMLWAKSHVTTKLKRRVRRSKPSALVTRRFRESVSTRTTAGPRSPNKKAKMYSNLRGRDRTRPLNFSISGRECAQANHAVHGVLRRLAFGSRYWGKAD